ncbi:MAG: Ca-activated chloride channel [Pyrinomonadaceae bacterium]|nr:Ca-activated chloride channel [Pyrinomonadaceae bacterium]
MGHQLPQIELLTPRAKLAAGREQTLDVLIRVTPPEPQAVDAARRRPALNLSLVLDRSGSMGGAKIQHAREAARYCIDQLLPTDRLSVVIFDEAIEVLIPSQPAANKAALKESLAHIHARGSTALHEAWVRGGIQVSEHLSDAGINRVLLITDGQANVGLTNTDEIVTQSLNLHRRGVSTSTIGIGTDFNEDLLLPMAEAGGGNAWHVETADDMGRIFSVELEGLIAQVGHTVTLSLVPADGARIVDLLNDFELNETGRYKLPNLQAGQTLEVVAQVRVPAREAGVRLRLLDLKLGYTPQEAKSAEVVRQYLEVEFAPEEETEALPLNNAVVKAVQMLMNARARREAIAYMDAGDYDSYREVVSASIASSRFAFAPMQADADVLAELSSLEALSDTADDRHQDQLNRKRLSYRSHDLSRSKR